MKPARKLSLSGAQASVVAAMRSGYKLRYTKGMHASAWINNAGHQRVTSTAFALERMGVIERFNDKPSGFEFRLTELGRTV